MATRFVELNEAATMLGLTPDQLIEKRSNGEIHGYRDGASWKFKIEEIQRVKNEMASGSDEGPLPFDDDGLTDFVKPDTLSDDESGSIVVNEAGDEEASSMILASGAASAAESDLQLASASDLVIQPEASGTDLNLVSGSSLVLGEHDDEISLDAGRGAAGPLAGDSDVSLVPGVGSDTDVKLVADTGSEKALKSPSGIGADVLGDSDLKLQAPEAGGTGAMGTGSSKGAGTGGLGSEDLDIALDSELALSDDDEMVLGGSGVGSDLALNAESGIGLATPADSGLSLEADSGISLQTPTDSGLSLEEEPLDVIGSSISALELPEDESIELDEAAFGTEPAQGLKKDEDFLLTPDEMFADESDSGSQVIALEDSAAFDHDTADMLQAQGALLADTAGLDQPLEFGAGGEAAPIGAPVQLRPAAQPEADYSVWNIVGLLVILMFLSVTGILMSDIVRNMWAWEQGLDVSTSISEGVAGAFGLR